VLNDMEILSVVAFSFGFTAWFNHDGNKISSLVTEGNHQLVELNRLNSLFSSFIWSINLRFGSENVILSSSSVDT
jgi:hypothetical protein